MGSFITDGIKALGSFLTGGLSDKIIGAVENIFPPSLSDKEKNDFKIQLMQITHQQEMEGLKLLNQSEQEFNKRTIELEGTANDLKSIPVVGAIVIFLRGAFRPLTSYLVMYCAFMSLSGAWTLTEKQDSLLWVMVILVLGFFFGERAMKNVMPIIGQYFGNKSKSNS